METGLAFGECGWVDMVMHVDFRHVWGWWYGC
jgi:hypothetical protein